MIVISILTKKKDLAPVLALLCYFPLWSLQRKWLGVREGDARWHPGNAAALLRKHIVMQLRLSIFLCSLRWFGAEEGQFDIFRNLKQKTFKTGILFIYFQFSWN